MEEKLSSGISGLDDILYGGFLPRKTYLIRGGPGCGKTTLGVHFLLAGRNRGENVLFITLGEPEPEIRKNFASLKLNLDGVHFLDLAPTPEYFVEVESYDIFSPAEVELEPTTRKIVNTVKELQPRRIFVDSMTQFRYLASDSFQYRKQILSFLRFLLQEGATVLFSSEGSEEAPDFDLQFLADGVINMEQDGDESYLQVTKLRGSPFRPGRHAYRIGPGGVQVFAVLVPEEHRQAFAAEKIQTGLPEIDTMLEGGIERGTVTIISGPSGIGKTLLALQFLRHAAASGLRSVFYTFEEDPEVLKTRARKLNMDLEPLLQKGLLDIVYIQPLQYYPDEFACRLREDIERQETRMVVLDSISGYRLAIRGEKLDRHLYNLCRYFRNMGVTALMVDEVPEVTGTFHVTSEQFSYLGDNLIFLRFIELDGELRRAIGILKKRLSDFEHTLREFSITPQGIRVEEPLKGLHGILSGIPKMEKRR